MEIRRLIELEDELWQTGNWDQADLVYADDVEFTNAGGDTLRGRDVVVDYFQREHQALPSSTTQQIVAIDGPVAVVGWTMTGQHTKDLTLPSGDTIPATGKPFSVDGVTVIATERDRITSMRRYHDRLGVLVQLGVVPGFGQ